MNECNKTNEHMAAFAISCTEGVSLDKEQKRSMEKISAKGGAKSALKRRRPEKKDNNKNEEERKDTR